mmetsp:Transcript_49248/g.148243  ORF Transcript_49248/g.148243 Transcript_49248/m.148243 type:complete len:230 (-) Transcript_49248:165-854(-)
MLTRNSLSFSITPISFCRMGISMALNMSRLWAFFLCFFICFLRARSSWRGEEDCLFFGAFGNGCAGSLDALVRDDTVDPGESSAASGGFPILSCFEGAASGGFPILSCFEGARRRIQACLLRVAASDGVNPAASITFCTVRRGAIAHVLTASSTRGSSGDVADPSADMLRSCGRAVVQRYQRQTMLSPSHAGLAVSFIVFVCCACSFWASVDHQDDCLDPTNLISIETS